MKDTGIETNKMARDCIRDAWLRNSLWYRFVHA